MRNTPTGNRGVAPPASSLLCWGSLLSLFLPFESLFEIPVLAHFDAFGEIARLLGLPVFPVVAAVPLAVAVVVLDGADAVGGGGEVREGDFSAAGAVILGHYLAGVGHKLHHERRGGLVGLEIDDDVAVFLHSGDFGLDFGRVVAGAENIGETSAEHGDVVFLALFDRNQQPHFATCDAVEHYRRESAVSSGFVIHCRGRVGDFCQRIGESKLESVEIRQAGAEIVFHKAACGEVFPATTVVFEVQGVVDARGVADNETQRVGVFVEHPQGDGVAGGVGQPENSRAVGGDGGVGHRHCRGNLHLAFADESFLGDTLHGAHLFETAHHKLVVIGLDAVEQEKGRYGVGGERHLLGNGVVGVTLVQIVEGEDFVFLVGEVAETEMAFVVGLGGVGRMRGHDRVVERLIEEDKDFLVGFAGEGVGYRAAKGKTVEAGAGGEDVAEIAEQVALVVVGNGVAELEKVGGVGLQRVLDDDLYLLSRGGDLRELFHRRGDNYLIVSVFQNHILVCLQREAIGGEVGGAVFGRYPCDDGRGAVGLATRGVAGARAGRNKRRHAQNDDVPV